jgi:hypothetical protein
MKKVFFDIDNGSVIKPREITAPEYYALLDDNSIVTEIHSSFSSDKISVLGYGWMHELLHKDCFQWVNYSWLMNSLKMHINRLEEESKDDYDIDYKDQYVYMKFWKAIFH